MFVSMRQRETALSRLPLWVVYKKICHIFLNPHHQPPCSTQPLVTPDWSCNVFPLSFLLSSSLSESPLSLSLSLSLHMLLWDLGRLQTRRRETKWERKRWQRRRRECLKKEKRRGGAWEQSDINCRDGERENGESAMGGEGCFYPLTCLPQGVKWSMASALVNTLTCDGYLQAAFACTADL